MSKRRAKKKPDFYLSSEDCDPTGTVHETFSLKRLTYGSRDDFLLVKIDPPFEGRRLGAKRDLLGTVLIAPRWTTRPLFPVAEWPVAVYIFAPMTKNLNSRDEIFETDVKLVGWGMLYPTAAWAGDPYGHAKSQSKEE